MLNRRILRIKVFKVLYGYAENPSMSLREAEAELEISCQAVRDLYLYMLSLIPPLTAEASARIEAARAKFNPTEEERHPNLKFVQNRIAPILEADPDFKKLLSRKKLSWDQNDAFLRKLYERIRDREYFQAYLDSGKSSLREDAAAAHGVVAYLAVSHVVVSRKSNGCSVGFELCVGAVGLEPVKVLHF